MMAQLDTTRLQKIYRGMENDCRRLMARYKETGVQMPSDMQAMYQQGQQMHGRVDSMHQRMMSGGMMHEGGMMGQSAGKMRRKYSGREGPWSPGAFQ